MATLEIKVTGRVQGVGFRNFVREQAMGNQIAGETWNGRDGAVFVIAQHHDPNALKQFAENLKSGPGRVDSVSTQESDRPSYPDFRITRDR